MCVSHQPFDEMQLNEPCKIKKKTFIIAAGFFFLPLQPFCRRKSNTPQTKKKSNHGEEEWGEKIICGKMCQK